MWSGWTFCFNDSNLSECKLPTSTTYLVFESIFTYVLYTTGVFPMFFLAKCKDKLRLGVSSAWIRLKGPWISSCFENLLPFSCVYHTHSFFSLGDDSELKILFVELSKCIPHLRSNSLIDYMLIFNRSVGSCYLHYTLHVPPRHLWSACLNKWRQEHWLPGLTMCI